MAAGKMYSVTLSKKQIEFLTDYTELLGITIPAAIKTIINNLMVEQKERNLSQ